MKKYIYWFKYWFYKKNAISFYKELSLSQNLNQAELEQVSVNKCIKLINYAYENSDFYKKKYDNANVHINEIKTKEDILKLPILTKKEVKENLNLILTIDKANNNLGKGATGGSTGTPMVYYLDKRIPNESFAWRYLNWWKLSPWDDGVFIWRKTRQSFISSLMNKLAWWPVKKIKLDASILTKDKLETIVEKINKNKPRLIQGYIGSVYEVASFIDNFKIQIHSPIAIWVTSAPVMEYQKLFIEKVFKAPLYNEYGSSEIPWIAAQCNEQEHLHVNVEGRYLEIVNTDENGEGDIIITNLLDYYFPLIRYELGDRSKFVKDKCNCGINLPLISEVKGRSGDTIEIPELGKIDASYLTTIFDKFPNSILAFQIVQHKNYSITIKYVPNLEYDNYKNEVDDVFTLFTKIVENKIVVRLSQEIEILSDRGKSRYIIKE